MRTRATAVLRRPVAAISSGICASVWLSLLRGREFGRFRILRSMRMLRASVDLQLGDHSAAETVVRDHAPDCLLNEQFRMAGATIAEALALVATDITGEAHVALLNVLL